MIDSMSLNGSDAPTPAARTVAETSTLSPDSEGTISYPSVSTSRVMGASATGGSSSRSLSSASDCVSLPMSIPSTVVPAGTVVPA